MRVAIIQSETRFFGGIERITEGLLQYSDWRSIVPHVVFLRAGVVVDEVAKWFPPERICVLDAGRLRQPFRAMRTVGQLATQLRKWRIDATLSQGFHSQCYGGMAAHAARVPNLFWCHALIRPNIEGRDWIVRLARRGRIDAAIGYPEGNRRNLDQFFGPRIPVDVVFPSGPMAKFGAGNGQKTRDEFGISTECPIAVMIGRVQQWKGQHVFIEAAAQLASKRPNARFFIVGGLTFEKDREYIKTLRSAVNQFGLAGNVIFTGERPDVPDFIAAANVVVHASVDPEPFGLVVIEAMAAGRPVIASRAGGPFEIIEDGVSGILCEPGNAQEFGEAMCRVIDDPALARNLGDAARRRVAEKFSFQRMAERLETILGSMVTRSSVIAAATSD